MFTHMGKLAVVLFSVGVLATCARADILDRIFDAANASKERAREARDRAREAGITAQAIRDRIQAGFENLSEAAISEILETAREIRELIEDQKAEFQNFEAEGCEECRGRIVEGLVALESLLNQLYAGGFAIPCTGITVGETLPDVELHPMIELLEQADCKVLFPICKAFGVASCVLEKLPEASRALQTIQNLVGDGAALLEDEDESDGDAASESGAVALPALDQADPVIALVAQRIDKRWRASQRYLVHYPEIDRANRDLKKTVELLTKLVNQFEANEKERTATLGIHGYVLITIDLNQAKRIKNILSYVKTAVDYVTKHVDEKLKEAKDVSGLALIVKNQIYISQQIAEIHGDNIGSASASAKPGDSAAQAFESLGCGGVGVLPLTIAVACVALLRWTAGPRRTASSSAPHGSHSERS